MTSRCRRALALATVGAALGVGCEAGPTGVHVLVELDPTTPPTAFDHVTVVVRRAGRSATACIFQTSGESGAVVAAEPDGTDDPCADRTPSPSASPTPSQWRLPESLNVVLDADEEVEIEAFAAFGNRRVATVRTRAKGENPYPNATLRLARDAPAPCVEALAWGTSIADNALTACPPPLEACPSGTGPGVVGQTNAIACTPRATVLLNQSPTCSRVVQVYLPPNRCVSVYARVRWARCADDAPLASCRLTSDCVLPQTATVTTSSAGTSLACLPALPYSVVVPLGTVERLERITIALDMSTNEDPRACRLFVEAVGTNKSLAGTCL